MIFDIFSVWHIIGAIVVGLIFSVFFEKTKKMLLVAIAVPAAWEVIEQNILVSWIGLLEAEPLLNSFSDILIGFIFIMVGHLIYKHVMKKR
jgi:membrane protein CcdC involved in cytochrome C biogenesis